ncbi:MAG: FAD-dependent oxidoreductase [Bryobacterales bacterium]|nr:FAD-dependent oxidoreductase [Bryobacterales bacterium]
MPVKPPHTGKTVAVASAGPAGLSAAFYLLQKGHSCTLFDAAEAAGGMLRYGIPAYRLPKDALDAEIGFISQFGARWRMGERWGRDFSLASLRRDHDAVFLATGAQQAQGLQCEGEEHALPGIEFLEQVAKDHSPRLGRSVIVIGGGNTAMDCARSAIRLGGCSVKVLYRRTRNEMPCLMDEVEGAEAEGVEFEFLVSPVRLESTDGRQILLTCRRMKPGEPDASGRRIPVPVEGSDFSLECSTVIAATGQSVERTLAEREGLRVTTWGIAADERTLATNIPGVFAGGDAVLGADLAVRAVAAGRIAASIRQYLLGEPVVGEPSQWGIAMHPVDELERAEIFRAIEKAARIRMPEIGHEQRLTGFAEIEKGLTEEDARREAYRCMSCGCRKADCCDLRGLAKEYQVDPYRFAGERRRFSQDNSHPEIIYEPGKCILCGVCVRIAGQAGEPLGLSIVGRGFEVAVAAPFGRPLAEGLRHTALRCAEACPSGALALRTARACDLPCDPQCGAAVAASPVLVRLP